MYRQYFYEILEDSAFKTTIVCILFLGQTCTNESVCVSLCACVCVCLHVCVCVYKQVAVCKEKTVLFVDFKISFKFVYVVTLSSILTSVVHHFMSLTAFFMQLPALFSILVAACTRGFMLILPIYANSGEVYQFSTPNCIMMKIWSFMHHVYMWKCFVGRYLK